MKIIDAEDGRAYFALNTIMIWKRALDEQLLANTLLNPEFG